MDELLFEAHNKVMTTQSGLWLLRSKDNAVMALYESETFRKLYEYVEKTWPDMLMNDAMNAMRIR